MSTTAEYLRSYAGHFAPRDWDYTRSTDIKLIRYGRDNKGSFTFRKRLKRALGGIFEKETMPFLRVTGVWNRLRYKWVYFKIQLRLDENLPDGVLDGGNVITHWEETGEYIQLVQPSVGLLLADFLEAEPENPHALKIAAEMERIIEGYVGRNKKPN